MRVQALERKSVCDCGRVCLHGMAVCECARVCKGVGGWVSGKYDLAFPTPVFSLLTMAAMHS